MGLFVCGTFGSPPPNLFYVRIGDPSKIATTLSMYPLPTEGA